MSSSTGAREFKQESGCNQGAIRLPEDSLERQGWPSRTSETAKQQAPLCDSLVPDFHVAFDPPAPSLAQKNLHAADQNNGGERATATELLCGGNAIAV